MGSMSIEITGATTAELLQFMKEGNAVTSKARDVVSVTRDAITAEKFKKAKRTIAYIPWAAEDILFMAKLAVDLGPEARLAASQIAKAMKSRAGNKRSYQTLYAMAYNVTHFLKNGNAGSMSKSTIQTLADNGYTSAMMSRATGNMLGDVRELDMRMA